MITKSDKSLLRQFFQSPQWKVIEGISNELKTKWRTDSVVGETEWDTVKKALLNEGQERGVNILSQELLDQAIDSQ